MPIPERHHLLVVDDDESVREVFTLLLEKEGYVVTTANNGFDALLKLKKIAPEVIISDLNMPEMSGFEFLSVVRRRFPQISVIASSGAYSSKAVPSGVLADAFYAKGEDSAERVVHARPTGTGLNRCRGGLCATAAWIPAYSAPH